LQDEAAVSKFIKVRLPGLLSLDISTSRILKSRGREGHGIRRTGVKKRTDQYDCSQAKQKRYLIFDI
jgi:hypothetical protein